MPRFDLLAPDGKPCIHRIGAEVARRLAPFVGREPDANFAIRSDNENAIVREEALRQGFRFGRTPLEVELLDIDDALANLDTEYLTRDQRAERREALRLRRQLLTAQIAAEKAARARIEARLFVDMAHGATPVAKEIAAEMGSAP